MKNLKLFLLSTLIVMVVTGLQNVIAQTNHAHSGTLSSSAAQTVNINSTYHYGVDSVERSGVSNIYTWSITPGVANTDWVITPASNTANKTIQWLTAGAYTVNLTEANPASAGSCSSVHTALNVTVSATPTGTVQFTSLTGTNQCSAAVNTAYTTNLNNSGTISYPITITYSITKNGTTTTGYTVSVATPGTSVTFPASDAFTVATADDATRRVTITGVTDSFGGTLTIGANATHTLTVWALPVISPIYHD